MGNPRTGARAAALAASLALAGAAGAATPPPNVVLVSIDTLRADHLPSYGYSADTAPFLSTLAENGILFEDAVVPLPNTTPSHGSLLTSLPPSQHGSVSLTTPLLKDVDTLAAAFARSGYATGGFVAVSHVGRGFNFDKGFEEFTQPTELARPGGAVNADALAWLDRERGRSSRRPVFLFVHYFDVHAPYGWWKGPEAAAANMDVLPLAERIRRYDESIRHVDGLVRGLHEALKERGFLDDAVFCVTSDHGEQIGEHGVAAGHADVYRETVRVPLLVAGKDLPALRVARRVSSMDIGVSLLAWAGGRYAGEVAGRNVLPARDSALGRISYRLNKGGGGDERSFLVTGNPPYTRSIALLDGRRWFIRNLDRVYRSVRAGPPPQGGSAGFKELAPAETGPDGARRTIPQTAFEPFVVTVDVRPPPTCPVSVVVTIPPGLTYFEEPRRSTPVRLQFGASRLDLVSVTTKPAACSAKVSYRLDRPGAAPDVPEAVASETALYGMLFAARKGREGDELYDVVADPAMTNNLVEGESGRSAARQMERSLRRDFETVFGKDAGRETRSVSAEELKRLRSLGYLF